MAKKLNLLVDFDGVVHAYTTPWSRADIISDGPVDGAEAFLGRAWPVFNVQIYSSRSGQPGGREAMQAWCREQFGRTLTRRLSFPETKPPAHLTIDDRVYLFEGEWPELAELVAFKPWNRR